jgi:hypothetical protein
MVSANDLHWPSPWAECQFCSGVGEKCAPERIRTLAFASTLPTSAPACVRVVSRVRWNDSYGADWLRPGAW